MIEALDVNGDGVVSRKEFVQAFDKHSTIMKGFLHAISISVRAGACLRGHLSSRSVLTDSSCVPSPPLTHLSHVQGVTSNALRSFKSVHPLYTMRTMRKVITNLRGQPLQLIREMSRDDYYSFCCAHFDSGPGECHSILCDIQVFTSRIHPVELFAAT